MGNNIFICYIDQDELIVEQQEREQKLKHQSFPPEEISLDYVDPNKNQYDQSQDRGNHNKQAQNQQNNLQQDKKQQVKNLEYPPEIKQIIQEACEFKSVQQFYNDPISNRLTTQFQQVIASTFNQMKVKRVKNIQTDDQEKVIILNDNDLQMLICLKWCVVDYFNQQRQFIIQNTTIQKCYQIFIDAAKICQFYKKYFLEIKLNLREYQNIYSIYQKFMNFYANRYEGIINEMQELYQNYFDFQNENKEYPQFKVQGYMIRFWCQIVLSENIQNILQKSLKQSLNENKSLCYQYVCSAIDVNINEYSINWIGSRQNFQFDNKMLLTEQFKFDSQQQQYDYFQQVDNKFDQLKPLYPDWYYRLKIEYVGIKSKIEFLIKQIYQNQLKLSEFISKQNFEDLPQELQQVKYIILLKSEDDLKKSPLGESCQDLLSRIIKDKEFSDSINSLTSTSISTSTKVLSEVSSRLSEYKSRTFSLSEIQTENKPPEWYAQQMGKLVNDLIVLQNKLSLNEQILQQRATKYKLKQNQQYEWLNFFAKTDFTKIPIVHQQKLQCHINSIITQLNSQDQKFQDDQSKFTK